MAGCPVLVSYGNLFLTTSAVRWTTVVEWVVLDLSPYRRQIVWLTVCLGPVRPTFGSSSLLLKYNSFEHWDVLDDGPSQGKCAVNRHLLSLVTVDIFCFRCQHPDWTSSLFAETGEATSSAAFDSSWRQECGEYGLAWWVSCPAVAGA